MELQDFFKSKVMTWLLVAVILVVSVGFGRVYLQKRQIDKEIAKLEERADKVAKDNEELSYLVKYFNTPEYQERQAREKLNLKKEGEVVIGMPEESEEASTQVAANEPKNHAKEWFEYFFANN